MQKFKNLILLLVVFNFLSCEKADITSDVENTANFVSIEEAIQIAESQLLLSNVASKLKRKSKIKSTFSIDSGQDNPTMHIINYEADGFFIVSADNRTQPILAYSETNSFPTNSKLMPDGLIEWLKQNDQSIKQIRKENKLQNTDLKAI